MKKNILFFTKNWLGDILFELPAIEAVRRAYPHARITCLTHKRCVEVVSAVPYIHEVIPYDEDGRHWGPWGHVRLARELRKYGFDQVYLFHRSLTRSLVMLFANIPTRIGYNVKGRGSFLTHAVPDPGQESMHHVDYFLNLVTSQGMKGPTHRTYEFFFSQKDNETAEALLKSQGLEVKKFIVFNPGSNWAPKRWPTLSFAQLGKKLPAIPIVVTGHQADQALFREMQTQAPHVQWISLCGKTSIRVLAAVLSKALFVVTGDSGPMHFASGVGAPVVALFGPTSPERTGPRGKGKSFVIVAEHDGKKGWQLEGSEREESMRWIFPEQVLKVIDENHLCQTQKLKQTPLGAF